MVSISIDHFNHIHSFHAFFCCDKNCFFSRESNSTFTNVRQSVCQEAKPLNSLKSSSFIIHHSSFVILPSSLIILHSPFIILHSSLLPFATFKLFSLFGYKDSILLELGRQVYYVTLHYFA